MLEKFLSMEKSELINFINEKKMQLGDELCILEHNFQLDDLLQFADVVGDTTSLLKKTLETDAKYLVYCGAKFFTEAGSILCPEKTIIQANMSADCPLTYEVDEEATQEVFDYIQEKNSKELIPVAYFTASYTLKSFCGRNNGNTCTASNAFNIIKYHLDQGSSIFFTPMSNIAYNVIKQLGIPEEDCMFLNEKTSFKEIKRNKKIYVWDIGCYVHSDFSVKDIEKVRNKHKDIRIISHLECLPAVIENSEYGCFTDGVWEVLKENPDHHTWGLATVSNFAHRLAKAYPEKTIVPIREDLSCKDMIVTDLPHLADCLQSIVDYKENKGTLRTQLIVPEEHRVPALNAINRMYDILKEVSV